VLRTAATQQELDCHEVKIDYRPDRITIRQVQFDRRECRTIRASQSLTLRVPPDALLDVSTIAGELQVTGPVQSVTANSIASHVSISGAETVDLISLAGGLSLDISGRPTRSSTIESVMGAVELNVGERRDVEIRISSLMGHIKSVPPDFVSRYASVSPQEARDKMVHDLVGADIGDRTAQSLSKSAAANDPAEMLSIILGSPDFQQQ